MDYYSLSRKELQVLCKKHGLRANTTNVAMADALQSLNTAQDSDTEIRICDAIVLGNAGLNSPTSVTTSCRRTPLRTSTRSMVRTSRSKRESEKAEEEPKSPAAGGIENLEEASRFVAQSGRRITTRSSARKQMEKVEIAEKLITPAKAVATSVSNSRRRLTRVSARQQTLQEAAVQQEAEGKKEVLEKLRTPLFSSMICTRRSSRLRGKNEDSEANHLEQKLEKKFIDEKDIKQPDAEAGPDEISEELPGEPSITIQETHTPVSVGYKAEPSGKTMTEVPSINEATSPLKQSDPSIMDGELPSSEADQVAFTSHEASIGAVMLSAEVSDGARLVDQTTGVLADLEPENCDGFAQKSSFNLVEPENNVSEPLSSGKDSDNVPAYDGVLQFLGAAVTSQEASADAIVLVEVEEVPSEASADALEAGDGFIAQEASLNPVHPLPSEPADDEVLQFPGTASVEVPSADDGFIAQEASVNPVHLLPSEPENNVGKVVFAGASSDTVPITNEEVLQFAGIASVEAQEVPSAGDGFIAQEASLINPVHLLPSERENNVDEILFSGINCHYVPATGEEVLQVPGTASVEIQEVPSADVHHHETSAASIPDEFSGDLQQIEEVNEKSPSLGSWSASPLSDSLMVASLGPELFMVPAAESLQFRGVVPKDAEEARFENTCHDSLAIDLIATTTAVPKEVSGAFQQIEGANEKSPSFGSWSAKSPCSEFSMVRKTGKSISSIGSSRGKTLARIRMFTTVEACVDKENKSMNEGNIVVDKKNEKHAGLVEFENYSLRKLRYLVKEGIKNKVQMNERTPLETLSANCLLDHENREIA